MAHGPGRVDSMHLLHRLLSLGAIAVVTVGCSSSAEPQRGEAEANVTTSLDAPTTTTSLVQPDEWDTVLGEWAIGRLGAVESPGQGFVVFDQIDGRLAVSIGQGECFTDSGFVTLFEGVATMTRIGEQTPSECEVGPPLEEVLALVNCLEQGCMITVDGDALALRQESGAGIDVRLTATNLQL